MPTQVSQNGAGRVLPGFLLTGFLLALLGALLPAWGYHREASEFSVVGNLFLCLALGLVASVYPARRIMERRGISFVLVSACWLACGSLLVLGVASPPVSAWWRGLGMFALGFASGLLNMGLLCAISRSYVANAAGTVNQGGIWYGLGCVGAALLGAGAVEVYQVGPMLVLASLVPAAFSFLYSSRSFTPQTPRAEEITLKDALAGFRSPAALLFALLLFFQFGNEWTVAGWLPIFLIRRLGISPNSAILILALYWFFLMTGRLVAVAMLPRVRHSRLLFISMVSALFGCLILSLTKTGFGAASGAFFLGAGYSCVYPLVAEQIGHRFAYFHPGFFNGIFSVALLGGLLAPATVGYAAKPWGVGMMTGIPLLGTCMVMLLILAIWLESRLAAK
jgi:MFS transporter, FHS family, glucose/mannose:H+ symporter